MKKKKNLFSQGLSSFGSQVYALFSPKKKKEDQANDENQQQDRLKEEAIESPSRMVLRKFFHNPLGLVGLIGFMALFAFIFIGSMFVPFDPYSNNGEMKNLPPSSNYTDVPGDLLKEGVADIQSGVTFSAGISKNGKFYFWGLDSDKNLQMPEKVKKEIGDQKITKLAVGDRHILVLTENGKLYGWGNNNFKQASVPSDVQKLIDAEGIQDVGAGDQYSVLLTKEGTLKAWGSTMPNNLSTIPKKYKKQVKAFECGSVNILAQLKDNKFVVIGSRGTELDTKMPKEVVNGQLEVKDFARAQRSAVVLDSQGKLHTWGADSEGANDLPEIKEPIKEVTAGRGHFVALGDSGKLYAWGENDYGVTNVPEGEGYQQIFAGFHTNYAIKDQGYDAWGVKGFLFGTDQMGRDLFTRLVHGGKVTLQISFIAVIIQLIIGVIVGMISGFYGGWIDNLLMRFSEIIASFPFYPMIITLAATIPKDAGQYQRLLLVMVLLGILNWTGIARLVRGQILAERERDYITAARALGLREGRIMASHIFPNVLSIVIVQATLGYAGNLLSEAGLSFLGFGVVEPYPSWGNMMTSAQSVDVIQKYWWRWVFPGLAVFLTALTVNLIGDALRDALDPKRLER